MNPKGVTWDLGHRRRLTAAEERELVAARPPRPAARPRAWRAAEPDPAWRRWLASDERRVLIESNIPLALKVAGRARRTVLGEDAVGLAMLALCRAVDGFDPERGRLAAI